MKHIFRQRLGLRYTVRLYDTVVEQGVHWSPRRTGGRDWLPLRLSVPTPGGGALAYFRWSAHDNVDVSLVDDGAPGGAVGEERGWSWSNGSGVRVELDLVPRLPAKRLSGDMWGDVALMVMMLTLMVGVGQLNFALRQLMDGVVVSERTMEPSPELIARLLLKDYAGAERGTMDRGHDLRPFGANPSFSLPDGGQGPLERAGGAEKVDHQRSRGPGEHGTLGLEREEVPTEAAPELDDAAAAVEWMIEQQPDLRSMDDELPASIEKFLGWGFEDWLDVPEAGDAASDRMVRQLNLSQIRMRIDPDDKFAILTVAYYAYLAQNLTLCRDLYSRYVRLYPDDSAGYNNLALTYKRTGEYREEERLYRIALELNPEDTNVMNNLAVNLAHQGEFESATMIMERLETRLPGDAYADLHRAKIFASMGQRQRSLRYLRRALDEVWTLDSFHHIEFRQDLKLDPSFAEVRQSGRFKRVVRAAYGAFEGHQARELGSSTGVRDG